MYAGKCILAPMVRIGTLPTRLVALEYGCDLVFTPETIAYKLSKCRRVTRPGGLIDYVHTKSTTDGPNREELVLRLHERERSKCILQLGAADPETAYSAALLVKGDVLGVDLNCGCPKRFSTHAGMGAALLRDPDRLCSILRKLGTVMPVSCKIRIFPELQDTLSLVKRLSSETPIHSLTVHCRTAQMRYDTPANWNVLKEIRRVLRHEISLVMNGDVLLDVSHGTKDMLLKSMKQEYMADAVMIGRAAQTNLSVFSPDGKLLDLTQVHTKYLQTAWETRNHHANTKYVLIQSLAGIEPKTPEQKALIRLLYGSKSYKDLFAIYGIIFDDDNHLVYDDPYGESGEQYEEGYTREQQDKRLESQVNSILE